MTDTMVKIAGIRFRENWKVYDFDATDIEIAVGDRVIIDSERGQGLGVVVRLKRQQAPSAAEPVRMEQGLQIEEEANPEPGQEGLKEADKQAPKTLRKVLRKATEDDLVREHKNVERESEAFSAAQDMIAERELPMKLIRVEYSFDASRATFYFFSETRVDFRELVKDLAYKLKSRIEMRQIGVRDVARLIGGFGPCGRELCCAAFLRNFEPVSIRMAKKQEMVLNPAKISGVCGRLLCCLSYEYEMYDEIKKDVAGMRDAAVKEKKEEQDRRIAEERREAEERRLTEEKKRQEERKPQEPRRERQKEGVQKSGKPDKRRDQQQQEKKAHQPQPGQPREQQQQQQPGQEKAQAEDQKQQEGKPGKKKRRRFWRRKKKGQQGENKPPQEPQGQG